MNKHKVERLSFSFGGTGGSGGFGEEYIGARNGQFFKEPLCFTNFQSDVLSHYHQQITNMHEALKEVCGAKYDTAGEHFKSNAKSTSLLVSCGAFEFEVNLDSETKGKIFSAPGAFNPYSVTQRTWQFTFKLEGMPHAGVGNFIAVTHGFALVMLLPVQTIIDHSFTIDTIGDFLNEVDPGVLEKQTAFDLEAGHAVWCPFGFVPLVVGAGPPKANSIEDTKNYGLLQYLSQPIFDTLAFYESPKAVQVEVTSWLEKATSRNLGVLKGANGDLIKSWLKNLTKDKKPASDAPAAETLSLEPIGGNQQEG
jgi:hypothetical protein